MFIPLTKQFWIPVLLLALFGSVLYVSLSSPAVPVQAIQKEEEKEVPAPSPLYEGKYVVVNLETMKVDLRQGTTTLETFDIVSKGKPGSYYETIGGAYTTQYKLKNHFSSLGHVYMPWSTHIFGNYFIHGIPYYENGKKVSNEYSGGCVRLEDAAAKKVYDFVEKGTPVVITEEKETDFLPTATSTHLVESMEMTRYMVAIISLDFLSQDDEIIIDADGKTETSRRAILPRLIVSGDDAVSRIYARARGEADFTSYMNQKAKALGLTNTRFTSVSKPATTTKEEMERFMNHIRVYKPYLLSFTASSSTPLR